MTSGQLSRVSNDWQVKSFINMDKSIYWFVEMGWAQVARYSCKIRSNRPDNYRELLNAASYLGDIGLVRVAMGYFGDDMWCDIRDDILARNLSYASEQGHMDIVELLFGYVDNMEICYKGYMLACKNGHLDIVVFYLDQGLDVNCLDCIPFFHAIEYGHVGVVRMLISRRVDVVHDNCNALILAAKMGDLEMFKMLVNHGCDVDYHNIMVGGQPVDNHVINEINYYGHLKLLQYIHDMFDHY